MTVTISSITNAGELDRERLVLKVEDDLDIGKYAVFCCKKSSETAVSAGNIPAAYWFIDKPIKKNDLVVLYTKSGKRSEKNNSGGNTSHFFYWGKSESIWNSDYRAVLIESRSYKFSE